MFTIFLYYDKILYEKIVARGENMSYQVFISYRRAGGEALAYLIYEKLSNLGYSVFYDIESLSSGKFNTKLYDMIDACNDVLVLLPPGGLDRCKNDGDWFRREIAYAIKQNKNIVPVFMSGFDWLEEMPEDIQELRNYNGVHVTFDYFESFVRKLEKSLVLNTLKQQATSENKNLKHLLVWSDFDRGILSKLIRKLDMGEDYFIEIMEEPTEILGKDMRCIDTVILINTDVTKLANNDDAISKINKVLTEYTDNGGRLIVTHDIIYRRTRNEGMQSLLGCKITNFTAAEKVKYKKTQLCNETEKFMSLPEEFELHDNEICWGNYGPDVDVFFETEDGKPLVFTREYGRGVCIWLNPGDFKDYPPQSVAKPEAGFVQLMREAIRFRY